MATKSLSTVANENHLRNEIDILNRELQTKEATIRKLEGLIEKLQEDANIRRLTIDAQNAESTKQFSTMEAQSRELSRLQTQLSQVRSKLLDDNADHDLAYKELQYKFDVSRKTHDREMQQLRAEHLRERKRHDTEVSTQFEQELANQKSILVAKNQDLLQQLSSLRAHLSVLEQQEYDLRGALSTSDRELRATRVEVRRAVGGTPLITDVVVPDPVEKTIHGLERKVDRLKGNVITQTSELTKANSEKIDYKTRCRELQLELDDANRAKLRAELEKQDTERRLNRRVEELEGRLSTKSAEAKDRDLAVQKASRAKAHVDDKDLELTSLKDQLDAMKEELAHAKGKYEQVTDRLRGELSEERAKVEKLELKLHSSESQLDAERRKTAQASASHKTAEENLKKTKDALVAAEKESDKLSTRVAKLERNLRDMERATIKA